MSTRIQIRRDTFENWENTNPILADGEISYDKDTQKIKIGNGTSHWLDLPYISDIDLSPYALLTDLSAEEIARIEADEDLTDLILDEITARQNADIAEANARTFQDGLLDGKITTEKNRNDAQDLAIADLYIGQAKITTTTSITTNTLSTTNNLKQNGRNVLIANGVNAINITCEITSEAKFQAIYHKLGSANITFVAGAGVTLVQIDGTSVMTGAAGFQTASLHRDGNTFYLQISNR